MSEIPPSKEVQPSSVKKQPHEPSAEIIQRSLSVTAEATYEGPLPLPEMIDAYNRLDPSKQLGSRMVEDHLLQRQHDRELEVRDSNSLDRELESLHKIRMEDSRRANWGVAIAAVAILGCLGVAFAMVQSGQPQYAAGVIAVLAVAFTTLCILAGKTPGPSGSKTEAQGSEEPE